jgi:formylmethanofuran dehydrogenase subunit E
MKKILKPWEQWEEDAKKEKARVMRGRCSNCGETFEKNGLSAYPGICKKCVESI